MKQSLRGRTDSLEALYLPNNRSEPRSTVCDEAVKKSKEDLTAIAETNTLGPPESGKPKRGLSFFLAILSLMLVILIVSLDATALSVAIPVSNLVLVNRTLPN